MRKNEHILFGVLSGIGYLLVFGVLTAVIPSPLFTRMIPIRWFDYFFLITSSILIGIFVSVHYYQKKLSTTCKVAGLSGGVGSFLAFSCPICNKILILVFGATALMTYFEPYRPYLGIISLLVLIGAIYYRVKN